MKLEIYNQDVISGKMEYIANLLRNKKVIVAFSGGVDSTVLAYLTSKYADKVFLVMQTGVSVAIGEKEFAQEQAEQLGLTLHFIEYNEVELSEKYSENPSNRCYFCKQLLHGFLEDLRIEKNFDVIVTGTNKSDLQGHRPGHLSAIEAGVLSPMAEAGLTKQEIRWIANDAGLMAADKPASACLASRFITGVRITKGALKRVAEAEYFLKNEIGASVVRVRDHGNHARIEFGENELSKYLDRKIFSKIDHKLKSLGYLFVSLDLQGYRPSVPV